MASVWLTGLGVAHPPHWVSQEEAARRIGVASGEARRVAAIARGTQITGRAVALPPDEIGALGSIEARNRIYQDVAPVIAAKAATQALGNTARDDVSFLATSSCTGYMIPGLDVVLAQALCLDPTVARLPVTEAGCSGGLVAIARVADYLRAHPGGTGLAVASELCSLAFHPNTDDGNLTSALLFGDGAGAARIECRPSDQPALEIVDSLSYLVPGSRPALGFELTDRGFYPILSRDLPELLVPPTVAAVRRLLALSCLAPQDVGAWLVHPGGPRILDGLAAALHISQQDLRWSWQAMREYGNTSSAAIFDVLRRYMDDAAAPRGLGVVIAFGPGVSIEMLLVRRC